MSNQRLRKGQVDPKNPHATSVRGAVKPSTNVANVNINGRTRKAADAAVESAAVQEVKYKIVILNWDEAKAGRGTMTFNNVATDPMSAWDNLALPETMLRDNDIINIFTDVDTGTLDKQYYPVVVSTCVLAGSVKKANLDVTIEWKQS